MKILIVDDSLDNVYLFKSLLGGAGHEVLSARNGLEALQKLQEQPCDLIVSDVLMPQMDGYQFCREVKRRKETRHIPFVFYTATYTDGKDEELGLSLGAARFIIKPEEPEKLLATVLGLLNQMAEGKDEAVVAAPAIKEEEVYLKAYNERLVRKLESHVVQLEVATREATQLRHLLSNIIDSMPSVLVGVDAEARIILWNQEAQRVTGVTGEAAMGKEIAAVLPQIEGKMDLVRKSVRERVVQRDEKIYRDTPDGRRISELTVYPLIADGVSGAVVRIDDVTQRVMMEELMIQSEKMRSVGNLAAGMAHEINNPLAGMLQSAQVVLNRFSRELPANQKAAAAAGIGMDAINAYLTARGIPPLLEAIRDSGQRAAGIVQNMLGFSRKSEAGMRPQKLSALLDKAVELASHHYEVKRKLDFRRIRIEREYASDIPEVECLETEIEQVLINLLKNAAQAMAEAGAVRGAGKDEPHITLRTALEGGMARIEVEDNGPGMVEGIRDRVFEPFFTTKSAGEGTGLGLSVSYFIVVENHGGKMAVESTPGHGAKFIIRLPVRQGARP